jgi:hypothetical protein
MPARTYARRRPKPRSGTPLTLWRTTEPARITSSQVAQLAKRVAATEILHERRWNAARNGDAAAAVAVAMDHLHRRGGRTSLTDVIVGNLVLLALRGDATAPVVIAHALHALGRLDPVDADLPRLARLWSRRPLAPRPRERAAGA